MLKDNLTNCLNLTGISDNIRQAALQLDYSVPTTINRKMQLNALVQLRLFAHASSGFLTPPAASSKSGILLVKSFLKPTHYFIDIVYNLVYKLEQI